LITIIVPRGLAISIITAFYRAVPEVVCRSFIALVPILRMFSNPLSGLRFGGETLDYFCLAIRPKNIDHPAKSWIFSRHENGPVFGHLANMRLRRSGSSLNRMPYSKEPTTPRGCCSGRCQGSGLSRPDPALATYFGSKWLTAAIAVSIGIEARPNRRVFLCPKETAPARGAEAEFCGW
jgi:hypothetical protein